MLDGPRRFADEHHHDPAPSLSGSAWEGASVDADAWLLDDRPTLLIIAETPAQAELDAMGNGAGFRVTACVTPDAMAQHLTLTVGVDTLLMDLRGLSGDDAILTRLTAELRRWSGWCDARPLILVDIAAVEAVSALLAVPFDHMLCEATLSDVGLELCLLARRARKPAFLSDIGRETDSARLDQLSAEVRRLAQTIDRMANDGRQAGTPNLRDRAQDYAPPPSCLSSPTADAPDRKGATREEISRLLAARRMRDRFMPGDLFADPAWDMMLDLLGARIDGKLVSVSSLCIAAAVPPTTALRWITQLTERGLFVRRNDPDDARRVFISLSEEAAESLAEWFSAVRRTGLRFVA